MKLVIYHSAVWALLVETGWMTDSVYEHEGQRVARMVRRPYIRRWL